MKTWFTSDLHFGHNNIIKFCPDTRPFADANDMDEKLIAKWNSQVAPNDVVYIVGDVFFHKANKAQAIMDRLNGTIHLVFGNHDYMIKKNPDLLNRFASAQDYLVLHLEGIEVVLFHFPIFEWYNMHRGAFHLFGHVHGAATVPGRAMDVGIDTRDDYGLWSWDEVKANLSAKEIRPHH